MKKITRAFLVVLTILAIISCCEISDPQESPVPVMTAAPQPKITPSPTPVETVPAAIPTPEPVKTPLGKNFDGKIAVVDSSGGEDIKAVILSIR